MLNISNSYIWRCPTDSTLLPFFKARRSSHHLDVGVGTGYYLAKAKFPTHASVTLCDLNPDPLQAAKTRLESTAAVDAKALQHDIEKPLSLSGERLKEHQSNVSVALHARNPGKKGCDL